MIEFIIGLEMAFRKSFKVIPGVKINLSSRGASMSLGPKGAKLNVSRRGVRSTVTVPRTGLTWTKSEGWKGASPAKKSDEAMILVSLSEELSGRAIKLEQKLGALERRLRVAREILEGGRGATNSKLATYSRKLLVEEQKVTAIIEDWSEQIDYISAVESRLKDMRFGWFSGAERRRRDNAVIVVDEIKTEATNSKQRAIDMLDRVSVRIQDIKIS